jgi:hypothetical protein
MDEYSGCIAVSCTSMGPLREAASIARRHDNRVT